MRIEESKKLLPVIDEIATARKSLRRVVWSLDQIEGAAVSEEDIDNLCFVQFLLDDLSQKLVDNYLNP